MNLQTLNGILQLKKKYPSILHRIDNDVVRFGIFYQVHFLSSAFFPILKEG